MVWLVRAAFLEQLRKFSDLQPFPREDLKNTENCTDFFSLWRCWEWDGRAMSCKIIRCLLTQYNPLPHSLFETKTKTKTDKQTDRQMDRHTKGREKTDRLLKNEIAS